MFIKITTEEAVITTTEENESVVKKDYKQERRQVSRMHGNAEDICNMSL
jgi:hypothetical protein